MREKLSELVCAVVSNVLRQSAARKNLLARRVKLFIEVSLRNLYIILNSYLHNSHPGKPAVMTTTDSIRPTAYLLQNKQGKIINSKVVRFRNGLCRSINEDSNPSFS